MHIIYHNKTYYAESRKIQKMLTNIFMVSDDAVYLHDDRQVREYVENDVGKVWNGTYKNYFGRPWNFGQFEDSVLPACCFILDKSRLKPAERGNPVKVCRAISAMVGF